MTHVARGCAGAASADVGLIDANLQALTRRGFIPGPDGDPRIRLYAGEGEFVCAECDTIIVDQAFPKTCDTCGSRRIETLTALQPPTHFGVS